MNRKQASFVIAIICDDVSSHPLKLASAVALAQLDYVKLPMDVEDADALFRRMNIRNIQRRIELKHLLASHGCLTFNGWEKVAGNWKTKLEWKNL